MNSMLGMHGESKDARLRVLRLDAPRGFHAVQVWHGNIEHYDVRLQLPRQAHRVPAVARLAHHVETGGAREQRMEPFPDQGVVIRHENPQAL